jgi:hypothetical protein
MISLPASSDTIVLTLDRNEAFLPPLRPHHVSFTLPQGLLRYLHRGNKGTSGVFGPYP